LYSISKVCSAKRLGLNAHPLGSLTAEVSVRLSERATGHEIFPGKGRHAGLELGGVAAQLTSAA
jgi:hypothetical protein